MQAKNIIFSNSFKHELQKTIKGFHLVNKVPIKESVWENILSQALSRCMCQHQWMVGDHTSGKDIIIGDQGISCKTTKLQRKKFVVSSYRMTKCKSTDEFVNEIDNVRNNFKYYLILARTEKKHKEHHTRSITYALYAIPSRRVCAQSKTWSTHVDSKTEKVKKWTSDENNGYKMQINSSMSNQLWMEFERMHFDKYCVFDDLSIDIQNATTQLDYASLFEQFSISS
jgi:hypothetical protein